MPELVLIGGPAGAGKTTLARAWAARRHKSAVVELDGVRDLIVGGRVDPQVVNDEQASQYFTSVRASAAIARAFYGDGYSVAIEEVFPYELFHSTWAPLIHGLRWKVVVVRPSLDATLARSRQRSKRVWEEHTVNQHAITADWPAAHQLDTTELSLAESLTLLETILGRLPYGVAAWRRSSAGCPTGSQPVRCPPWTGDPVCCQSCRSGKGLKR